MKRIVTAIVIVLAAAAAPPPLDASAPPPSARDATRPSARRATADAARTSLLLVENRGQTNSPDVVAYAKGRGVVVHFTPSGLTYAFARHGARWAVKSDFAGADAGVRPSLRDETQTVVSYFKGPRPSWRTGLRTFREIEYRDVWPGIDVVYRADGARIKQTLRVAPGADASRIAFRWRGATRAGLDADGRFVVETPVGGFTDDAPAAWQGDGATRRDVAVAYATATDDASTRVGFRLGAYDRALPLVVDPAVVVYSGLIGGDDEDETAGIAVDAQGAAYVVGRCRSHESTFPETAGPDTTFNGPNGDTDGFIAKVLPDGTGFVYCGYVGSVEDDRVRGVAVDAVGNAYMTGYTEGGPAVFPATVGPSLVYQGGGDAFVAKLNAAGTDLLYCGYLGGAGDEYLAHNAVCPIAVDASGNAFVCGTTRSNAATFPVSVGPKLTYSGLKDGFIAKVKADGTGLEWCGYVGGAADEEVRGIVLASDGNPCIVGWTASDQTTFPVSVGPDLVFHGGKNFKSDAFVAKVKSDGTGFVYCGYIGGPGDDWGWAIDADAAGGVYLGGQISYESRDAMPVAVGPMLAYQGGDSDGFVAKLNSAGTAFAYFGFIGGTANGDDAVRAIKADASGAVYVGGETDSDETKFPVSVGPDLTYNGGDDAFVAKMKADATGLEYAGYVGGSSGENCRGIAVDSTGAAYVVGDTESPDFPTLVGPRAQYFGNPDDVFVVKVSGDPPATVIPSFFLPRTLTLKVKTPTSDKDSLVGSGYVDDGGVAIDFTHPVTVKIGGWQRTITLAPNKKATKFTFKDDTLNFVLTPNVRKASLGFFTIKIAKTPLGALIDATQPLEFRFDASNLPNASGSVKLTNSKYKRGSRRGDILVPHVFPAHVIVKLGGDHKDSLTFRGGFASGGASPTSLGTVRFAFGDQFTRTIAGNLFVKAKKGSTFTYKTKEVDGTKLSVSVDFERDFLKVDVSKGELGPLTTPTTDVVFDAGDGQGAYRNVIRLSPDKRGKRDY